MNRCRGLLATILFAGMGTGAPAVELTAFSLRVAEQRLRASAPGDAMLIELGGITRLAALVVDRETGDVIVVGQADASQPKATLDDLVVALRAPLLHAELPLVSIERTADTARTREQVVRYEGGIADTQLGKDFLEADVILKRLALGLESPPVPLTSYFALKIQALLDRFSKGERNSSGVVQSRFWFIADDPPLVGYAEDIVAVRRIQLVVRTEVLGAAIKGQPVLDPREVHDQLGNRFAEDETDQLSAGRGLSSRGSP